LFFDQNISISPFLISLVIFDLSFRIVYRDIGGSDPERMAAPRVADYVVDIFTGTCIKVCLASGSALQDHCIFALV